MSWYNPDYMRQTPAFLILFFSFALASVSNAQSCKGLLSATTARTNLSLLRSFDTYRQLKSSPMWNHQSPQLNKNALQAFTQTTTESSAQTLFSIYNDFTDPTAEENLEKLLSLLNKPGFYDSTEDLSNFRTAASLLERQYSYLIDFDITNPTRLSRFQAPGSVVLRSAEDIQNRLNWLEREKETQVALFQMIAQTADDSIKSQRFVYEPSLNLKPFPEEMVLLVFMIRGQHYELFEALVKSPQIYKNLHLDYSVMLIDEIDELPSSIRHTYTQLAIATMSPEALAEYQVGKRGVNRTMWDRIPLHSY